MKNTFIALLFISLAFPLFSQTKSLAEFSNLKVQGRISVSIKQSDSNFIEILDADDRFDINKLELIYKGKELGIKYLGSTIIDLDLHLAIYCKDLKAISAMQGAEITVEKSFILKGKKLTFTAFAGGQINLRADAEWIEALVKQGGAISIEGNTNHFDVKVLTGGYVAASFLKANDINAEVKFGGEIICNPIEFIDAKIVSGGEINYKGSPEVNQSIKLGGSINQL